MCERIESAILACQEEVGHIGRCQVYIRKTLHQDLSEEELISLTSQHSIIPVEDAIADLGWGESVDIIVAHLNEETTPEKVRKTEWVN